MDTGGSSIAVTIAPDMAGWRLDRALAALIPALSRERLKALISAGHVNTSPSRRRGPLGDLAPDSRSGPRLREGDDLVRDPATKVASGTVYTITIPAPAPAHNEAQEIALDIVFEDDHLLVVDKPAGLVVHPAAGNRDGTLVNALLHHCAGRLSGIGGVARPGIVHRIDKDTSGLLVVAKTDRAHEGLAKQFADHSIERRYLAIVAGLPSPLAGTVDAPLARSAANRKKIAIVASGKRAVTHYRTIDPLRDAAMVECRLETGRTHQVRVHMASLGHPLLGDPVYGRVRREHRSILDELGFARQALHATLIGFLHPIDRKKLAFESPLPLDMQRLFTRLRV